MSQTIVQEDTRLINLYSQSATQFLNNDLKSNVVFNFKNILKDEPDIIYSTISIVSAQLPVSFYVFNEFNNKFTFTQGALTATITITKGNYTATSLITEMVARLIAIGFLVPVLTISSSTGKLTLSSSTNFTLIAGVNSTSFDILGLISTANTASVSLAVIFPFPLNLLGAQELRISSVALQTYNYNSSTLGESNLIGVIQNNAAPFGLIMYLNTNSYSVLRNKLISQIDIQITDENNLPIDFNGVDWTITFQLTIFRRKTFESQTQVLEQNILNTLTNIQADLEQTQTPVSNQDNQIVADQPPTDPTQQAQLDAQNLNNQDAQNNQASQDLFSDDLNSLDIMNYNKQLPG